MDVRLGFQPERWRPPRPFWRRAAGGVFFRFFLVIADCHKKKQKSAQYPPPPRVVADFNNTRVTTQTLPQPLGRAFRVTHRLAIENGGQQRPSKPGLNLPKKRCQPPQPTPSQFLTELFPLKLIQRPASGLDPLTRMAFLSIFEWSSRRSPLTVPTQLTRRRSIRIYSRGCEPSREDCRPSKTKSVFSKTIHSRQTCHHSLCQDANAPQAGLRATVTSGESAVRLYSGL